MDAKVDIGTKAVRFTRLDEFIVRALTLKSERRSALKKNNAQQRKKDGGSLKKVLNACDLVVIGVGGIVGAGVFVLTGTAAKENAGPALIVSYLIAMCASVFTALCYSEFATCAPTSGSAYNFISMTFGEVFAYITGWNLAIELTVGGAAVARGFTSYLATLFGLKPDAMRVKIIEHAIELDFCAFLLVSAMTLTIVRGMEQTKNFQFVVVTLAMATIAFVIIVGSAEVDVDNYTPFIPPEFGWQGVMSAASVVFFAFIGFDTVATLAEETKNPGKDLPIGILGSLAISGILYCAMAGVITGMVSYEQIDVDAPFSVAFTKNGIPWASVVVSCGAIFCIVTSLLGCLVGQPRVYMAMARDGLMPKCIANVSETYGTPVNASILTWALTGVLTLSVRYRYISTNGFHRDVDDILRSQPRAFGSKVHAERRSIRRHEREMAGAFASLVPLDRMSLSVLLGDVRTRTSAPNPLRHRRLLHHPLLPSLRPQNVSSNERLLQRAEHSDAVHRAVRPALPFVRRISHVAVDCEFRAVGTRSFRSGVFNRARELRGHGLRSMLRVLRNNI